MHSDTRSDPLTCTGSRRSATGWPVGGSSVSGTEEAAAENVPGVKRVRDHLVWVEPISGMVIDAPRES